MTERETRDIAVGADTKVEAHINDCVAVRLRIEASLRDIRDDLKKINWYLPLIIGGILVASHGFDLILKLMGH